MTPSEQQLAKYWDNGNFVEFDPVNDLNAMHEAEKLVENNDECLLQLLRIVETARGYDWTKMQGVDGCRCCAFATAAQRAEAFLRTLGLWEG